MNKWIIWLLLVGIASNSKAQGYIHSNEKQAKKDLENYTTQQNLRTHITETDTTISFLVRDPFVQNLDLTLSFNKKGKCIKEETKLSCDSCYQKLLHAALDKKQYKWTMINTGEYVSSYSKKLLLVTDPANFTYTITVLPISRAEYKKWIQRATSAK